MDILAGCNIFYAPLPDRRQGDRTIRRFLCRPRDKRKIQKAFAARKYLNVPYLTFTRENGYLFLYPMVSPDLFIGEDAIEIMYQLSVNAYAMDKAVIPLDKSINEGIFDRAVQDKGQNSYQLSVSDMLCFRIAYCIYDLRSFDEETIAFIRENKKYLYDEDTKFKLYNVFFNFYKRLTELIEEGRFTEILREYDSFSEY